MAANAVRFLTAIVLVGTGSAFYASPARGSDLPFLAHIPEFLLLFGFCVALLTARVRFFALGASFLCIPWAGAELLTLFISSWLVGFLLRDAWSALRGRRAEFAAGTAAECPEFTTASEFAPPPFYNVRYLAARIRRLKKEFGIRQQSPAGEAAVDTFKREASRTLLALSALILLTLSAALRTNLLRIDPMLLGSVAHTAGLRGLFDLVDVLINSWRLELVSLGKLLVGTCLLVTLQRKFDVRNLRALYLGVLGGVAFVICFGLGQLFELSPLFAINRAEFWVFTGRYSASLSDPNAFGVMAALVLPFLVFGSLCASLSRFERLCSVLLSGGLIAVVLWSGSRTFWLAVLLWIPVSLLIVKRPAHSFFRRLLLALVGLGVVAIALVLVPSSNQLLQSRVSSPGAQRILKTLDITQSESMFSSRRIFTQLALSIWESQPLVGVGLNRFRERVPAVARELGLKLGNWTDNANNFYLHVLAEQGLLGLAGLLCLLLLLTQQLQSNQALKLPVALGELKPFDPRIVKPALAVFLLLLLTGPHTEFSEVLYFVCLLIGIGLTWTTQSYDSAWCHNKRKFLLLLVLFVFTACHILGVFQVSRARIANNTAPQGFYAKEFDSTQTLRWTAGWARFALCDTEAEEVEFTLRALQPGLAENPLPVSVTSYQQDAQGKGQHIETELTDNAWHTIVLSAAGVQQGEPRLVTIEVDRLWSPHALGLSADRRWLGVQLKWPDRVCED